MAIRLTGTIVVLGACAMLAACKKETTDMPDTTTPATAMPTPPPPPALTDANIAALLDNANMADSADGNLASTKGTSADVKAFGKAMMADHHMLRQAGIDLAKQLSITPEIPAGNMMPHEAQMWHDSLTAMAKGAAWDKAYIDHEVTMHETVLQTIDTALGATQTPDLRALLEKAKPAVQGHLDRAKTIQTKLTGTN